MSAVLYNYLDSWSSKKDLALTKTEISAKDNGELNIHR